MYGRIYDAVGRYMEHEAEDNLQVKNEQNCLFIHFSFYIGGTQWGAASFSGGGVGSALPQTKPLYYIVFRINTGS